MVSQHVDVHNTTDSAALEKVVKSLVIKRSEAFSTMYLSLELSF